MSVDCSKTTPSKTAQDRLGGDAYGRREGDPMVHPMAVVAPEAVLGEGTRVGPFSVIGPDVTIGRYTIVGSHVVIEGYTHIGNDNLIYQFASVGAVPQDKKFHGEPSTLEIGDRNVIREYVTLQPGTVGGGMKTVIGSGNLFMACTHVGHDCLIGDDNIFANSVALAGHVRVSDRVIIGGLAGLHQFVSIGELALVGAGSMVSKDIPPYCIAQGDRAALVGVNVMGLQRAGISPTEVSICRKLFRELFFSSGNLAEALKAAQGTYSESRCGNVLLQFVAASERGVASLRRSGGED